MIWFYISLGAYFFNAIASLVSKILLEGMIPNAASYAFATSIFGGLVVFLMPFGFFVPNPGIIAAALISGVTFTFALLIFYSLLDREEATEIVPLVGGLTPVFVFVLAWIFLGEVFKLNQVAGFIFIVLGGMLIAYEESWRNKKKINFGFRIFILSALSGVLYAVSQVLVKFVYDGGPFLNGFIWRGFGSILGALVLMAIPSIRRSIMTPIHNPSVRAGAVFIFGQAAAVLSFILVNYAFSLGPVALVNAVSGTQYLFLFLFVLLLSKKYSKILKESMSSRIIQEKILSAVLIVVGIFLLFV